ncbi:MAG: hypothetical protein QOE68_2102 [Thermoanaerobaculia bacterium]|jgi:hypothetical protein|nr:hypothetical protein [Thermoanaerobaculia bacterium]
MAIHELPGGIRIEVPDDVAIEEVRAPRAEGPTRTTRRGGLPKGPIPIAAAAPGEDPVVAALIDQDLVLVQTFDVAPSPSARTRATPTAAPSRLSIEVEENEDSVILFEQDGIYSWRYAEVAETVAPAARRGPVITRAKRRVEFDLNVEPSTDPIARVRRGPVADFVIGKVRTYVFRFVARIAVGATIDFLERKARTGLVHIDVDDPKQWKPIERLDELTLPADRPARILLMVHGTFSTTLGSYGALGITDWGRAFLERARSRYDAIIGYDHRTLSRNPLQNAEDLLGRLEQTNAPSLEIDAVAFSRGGLVLRSLIEYLLPSASLRARVKRAVFVGATNAGTHLATRQNWERLIDLTTNLVAAGSRVVSLYAPAALAATIVRESIDTLGALVKAVAGQTVDEETVPGLAAMVPNGRFVKEINTTQPGQPSTADSLYYSVSSDFDVAGVRDGGGSGQFSARLARWAADALVDAAVHEPNDLVVHVASMSSIDEGGFVKDKLDLGRNPHVYHTIYFTREEVVRAMTAWLGLDPLAAAERLIVVAADEPMEDVLADIEFASPEYVVALRNYGDQHYKYAYRTEELREHGNTLTTTSLPLEEALRGSEFEMHEGTSSAETTDETPRMVPQGGSRSGAREILLDGATPRAVIEHAVAASPVPAATEIHETFVPPRTRGRKRSAGPGLPPPAAPKAAAPPPSGEIFVAADMAQAIPLHVPVPLNVLVSQDEIVVTAGPTSGVARAKISSDRAVLIHVVPKQNIEVVGDDRVEIDPAQPRTELLFEVKGVVAGPGEVWVIVRQGPLALAIVKLAPQVVAAVQPSPPVIRAVAEAQPADPDTETYPVLHISEWKGDGVFKYQYFLQLAPGQYISGASEEIKRPRNEYVGDIYKKIEARWLSTKGDFVEFQEELRTFGGTLLDELVPTNVQDALWNVRDSLTAIQVVAEEPFIPWELVHLKPPRAASGQSSPLPQEMHFLAQKGLVRWLANKGRAPLQLLVRKGRSFYLIPQYGHPDWDLPDAQLEIPLLQTTFGSAAVAAEDVRKLLRTPGRVDHFHFSGHGEADATKAYDAQLLISGTVEGGLWVPRYLQPDIIEQTAQLADAEGHRPLVVLNACQIGRAGWRLSSIGGFAHAFIHAQAGAFVGSLWSVGDVPARHFSEAFYGALVNGETLSRAAVAGREAAAKEEDGTWLAYVVYGYPHATMKVE